MTDDELVEMATDLFLTWPLPISVRSDLCVTQEYAFPRSGTNLLTADEAHQLIEYLFTRIRPHLEARGIEMAAARLEKTAEAVSRRDRNIGELFHINVTALRIFAREHAEGK